SASRQVWLASLGAAVVTREWAEREAGNVIRTLIKEGTAVESRAFRLVGDQRQRAVEEDAQHRRDHGPRVRRYGRDARAQDAAEDAAAHRDARGAAGVAGQARARAPHREGPDDEDRQAGEARRQVEAVSAGDPR